MFEAWGRWVYRHRWPVLVCSVLLFAVSLWIVAHGAHLTTGAVSGTEASRGRDLVERDLGHGNSNFTVIFHHDRLTADDPAFRTALLAAVAPLRSSPHLRSLQTPYDTPAPAAATLVSRDRHRALALVELREPFTEAARYYSGLRAQMHSSVLEMTFTDTLAINHDLDTRLEADLHRAEMVSIPAALIVLVLVFGTLVASLMPLGVGLLAVVGGVAGVFLLSRTTEVARYALNIVSLIGLGVAIDYSLFIVRRYQEELYLGATVPDAIARSMATAGHAVAFSGLAVIIGLSGLLFFHGSWLASVGIGGAIVVALAVLYALTFLPALLAVLGHGVNWGRIWHTRPVGPGRGAWHRIAEWVMARPVLVLVPTLTFLLLLGMPFLRVQLASADYTTVPADAESRRGHSILEQEFPERLLPRVVTVVHFPSGPVLTPERIGTLYDLSRRIHAIPGLVRVESVVDLDPRLTRENYQRLLMAPPAMLPPMVQAALHAGVSDGTAVISAVMPLGATRAQQNAVVRAIRSFERTYEPEVMVTGRAALDLDIQQFVLARVPSAIAFVMVMTYVVLFALLRSVFLPLKAVVMNLLSITCSFGALVWIFQEGHLSRLLRFTPAPIDPSLPVVLFCTVFGLSMDYEVFLLTRMREVYLRTRDNTHAVAEGLERSGRIVTSAAAIMVVVFAAFASAEVVLIKAVGLGMALAIAIDATIVRVLIVPATMRLFGDINWWAPGRMALPPPPPTGNHQPA